MVRRSDIHSFKDESLLEVAGDKDYRFNSGYRDVMQKRERAKARAHDLGAGDEDALDNEDDGKVETGDTDRGQATPAARDSDEESAI